MALDPILIGTTPNDNTGDPNRTAWGKVNTMFSELYAALEAAANAEDTADALSELGSAITSIQATLLEKLNSDALATKANTVDVPRFDQEQTLDSAKRRQLATNTGALHTFSFEIVPPNNFLVPMEAVVYLPRLPQGFIIQDAYITTAYSSGGVNDMTVSADLVQDYLGTPLSICQAVAEQLTSDGSVPVAVTASDRLLMPYRDTRFTLTTDLPIDGEGPGNARGLTFWIRGVWAA